MVDTLKKTIIKTTLTVQTPTDTEEMEIFGKVTTLNIRQMVRMTTRARCEKDGGKTQFDEDIMANNFIVTKQSTHTVMYQCDVYDFLKIAKPFKTIN